MQHGESLSQKDPRPAHIVLMIVVLVLQISGGVLVTAGAATLLNSRSIPAGNIPITYDALPTSLATPYSWNPRVACTPTVVKIDSITSNQTGSASFVASPYSPGITTPVPGGVAKRWLTPGTTPPGWVPAGPPCVVSNSQGTKSLFVELDGVQRSDLENEDFATTYDTTNGAGGHGLTGDTTFNLFDPGVISHYFESCTSPVDPTCFARIHAEIDHDWKAAGYCGIGTICDNNTLSSQTSTSSTKIDVQGFVSWDPENLDAAWHQFSGWEIHPLTAWKVSGSAPPSRALTSSIVSNFDGTPIASGRTIWFNSNFKASNIPNAKVTISFLNSFVTIGSGTPIPVPNARIVFDPTVSCSFTGFDAGTNTWITTVPSSGSDGVFLSGLALPVAVPITGGPHVTWTGTFQVSGAPSLSLSWKWGAAVYSSLGNPFDYNAINVKPAHTNTCNINNSDHAGTPENFKRSLIAGARGGGGSNWTGGWSGTSTLVLS